MKLKTLLLAGAATSLLAGPALAQGTTEPPTMQQQPGLEQQTPPAAIPPSPGTPDAMPGATGAGTSAEVTGPAVNFEDLRNANVVDAENANIASVIDVLVDTDGKAHHLVLSRGGMLGVGATYHSYEITALPAVDENDNVQLGLTADAVAALPEYEYPSADGSQTQAEAPAPAQPADGTMAAAPATDAEPAEGRASADSVMPAPDAASLWPVTALISAEIHGDAPAAAADLAADGTMTAPDTEVSASIEDVRFGGDGAITALVLSEGGLFGMGAEEREIPFERIQLGGTPDEPMIRVSGLSPDTGGMGTGPAVPPAAPAPAQ